MVKRIASEMVAVTLRRADNRTKKCKRDSNVFASREEKKQGWKNTKRKTNTTMHASSAGRGRKRKGYRVSDTEESRTSKNVKLRM